MVCSPISHKCAYFSIEYKKFDLAYIKNSPTFCAKNITAGSLGTQGRECNKNSTSTNSCDIICCGRGYDTREVTTTVKCNCEFRWCCYVDCHTCQQTVEKNFCRWNVRKEENLMILWSYLMYFISCLWRASYIYV